MTADKLAQLIERGESETLEFKTSLAERSDGLRSLCGMVNTDAARGLILFGVRPEGHIQGMEPGDKDAAQRSMAQLIAQRFEPPITATIEVHHVDAKNLLLVGAERRKAVPYHEFEGRAFIREGTRTRRLSLEEKNVLARQRNRDLHPGPWRCNRCNAWIGIKIDVGGPRSYICGCGGELWPAAW